MSYIRTFALLAAALRNCAALRAQQADMVLVHGTVLTVDAKDTVAQALAIRGGEIVAVGTDAQIMKLAGKTTHIVDLHGRTATPGMIDTHSHYTEAGSEDLYFMARRSNDLQVVRASQPASQAVLVLDGL